MAQVDFDVSPKSYTFKTIREFTTLRVDSEPGVTYTFKRANSYGSLTATFDQDSKILVVTGYGDAEYIITAKKQGKEPKEIKLDLHLPRPRLMNDIIEQFYIKDQMYNYIYTPPKGYTLKKLDLKTIEPDDTEINITPDAIELTAHSYATKKYDIVLSKIDAKPNEEHIEYSGGEISISAYQLTMDGITNEIYSKLNKVVTVPSIKAYIDNKEVPLTFETSFNGTGTDLFDIEVEDLTVDKYYDYGLNITMKNVGDGRIHILYKDTIELGYIDIWIIDEKYLTIDPDKTDIKLRFGEYINFTEIRYLDNDVSKEVVLESDVEYFNKRFVDNSTEPINDEPRDYNYTLTITNNKVATGGTSTLLVKGKNSTNKESRRLLNITCLKQVIPSVPDIGPMLQDEYECYVGDIIKFDYIVAEHSDRLEIISDDESIATGRFVDITKPILIENEDGSIERKSYPPYSVYKELYISTLKPGKLQLRLMAYVNDNDITSTTYINLNIKPNDALPDESSIVNLYANKPIKNRQHDIIVDLPEQSSTLSILEILESNTKIEYGYSFDYKEEGNPSKNTNPETYNENTGNPLWLNSLTNELFVCLDTTKDNNRWYGDRGTVINGINYPNPGERGFGAGVAPDELVKLFNLTECPGCRDTRSENYGNYYDSNYTKFVYIPKHHVIPKYNPDKVDVFPYDGLEYEFSYIETDYFTSNSIPRCFINNNKVVPGIFVAKYNNSVYNTIDRNIKDDKINYEQARRDGSPYIYTTTDIDNTNEVIGTHDYPELFLMSKVSVPISTDRNIKIKNNRNRHNMTIFIQTMLNNLADIHTIASYEKGDTEVCPKLKQLNNGVRVKRINNIITPNGNSEQNNFTPFELINGYIKYPSLTSNLNGSYIEPYHYSHNGQANGVFDINGGINMVLPGILIEHNLSAPDNYRIYALKKSADINKIEYNTFTTIRGNYTSKIIDRTPFFNLSNYEHIGTIVNDEFSSKLNYVNSKQPIITNITETMSYIDGSSLQYYSINSGINLAYLVNHEINTYHDPYIDNNEVSKGFREYNTKFSCFSLCGLDKLNNNQIDRDRTYYGMFTSNYVPTKLESEYLDVSTILPDDLNNENNKTKIFNFNGYKTRVIRWIGGWKYIKTSSNGSDRYMLSTRTCITPS